MYAKVEVPWISGRMYNLADINSEQNIVSLYDIFYGLSHICRFTGQTIYHYSVAQHSVLASYLAEPGYELHALLHDIGESVVGDITSPVKRLFPGITLLEDKVLQSFCIKFGFDYNKINSNEVQLADRRALATEYRDIVINHDKWDIIKNVEPHNEQITRMSSKKAFALMCKRYIELTNCSLEDLHVAV